MENVSLGFVHLKELMEHVGNKCVFDKLFASFSTIIVKKDLDTIQLPRKVLEVVVLGFSAVKAYISGHLFTKTKFHI